MWLLELTIRLRFVLCKLEIITSASLVSLCSHDNKDISVCSLWDMCSIPVFKNAYYFKEAYKMIFRKTRSFRTLRNSLIHFCSKCRQRKHMWTLKAKICTKHCKTPTESNVVRDFTANSTGSVFLFKVRCIQPST